MLNLIEIEKEFETAKINLQAQIEKSDTRFRIIKRAKEVRKVMSEKLGYDHIIKSK